MFDLFRGGPVVPAMGKHFLRRCVSSRFWSVNFFFWRSTPDWPCRGPPPPQGSTTNSKSQIWTGCSRAIPAVGWYCKPFKKSPGPPVPPGPPAQGPGRATACFRPCRAPRRRHRSAAREQPDVEKLRHRGGPGGAPDRRPGHHAGRGHRHHANRVGRQLE